MREHPRSDARPPLHSGSAFGCLRLAAIAAAALVAGSAYADDPILPHYQFQLGAWGPDTLNQNKTDFSEIAPVSGALGFPQGYASAFTRNDNGGLAQVNFKLTSSTTGMGNNQVSAWASFDYLLRVEPRTPDAPANAIVPVHMVAHGAASVTLDGGNALVNAGAFFKAWQNSSLVDLYAVDTDGGDSAGSGFAFDQEVSASTGSLIGVSLVASAGIISYGSSIGSGSAYVDPIFVIDDPHWASLYKIVGVPGDAPTPPASVPEPAAWSMMIAGFGAIGAAMRRRTTPRADRRTLPC